MRRQKNKNISYIFLVIISLVIFLVSQSGVKAVFGLSKTNEVGNDSMLRYYAINVGQGDCHFFDFPEGWNMLIDAGTPNSYNEIDAFLKENKVKKIDILVATHPHSDHIGSMAKIIKNYEIGEVWSSGYSNGSKLWKDCLMAIKEKNDKITENTKWSEARDADNGDLYQKISQKIICRSIVRHGCYPTPSCSDRTLIEVLAPVNMINGTKSDANNNSIVMLISYGKVKFLMTGDMEVAERAALKTIPKADVLKMAHHGSSNGTDKSFLNRVHPGIVIFSYGKNNEYDHPHRKTIKLFEAYKKRERAKDRDIKRFDTVDGTICISTMGDPQDVRINPKQEFYNIRSKDDTSDNTSKNKVKRKSKSPNKNKRNKKYDVKQWTQNGIKIKTYMIE